jgi:hypothetical protein
MKVRRASVGVVLWSGLTLAQTLSLAAEDPAFVQGLEAPTAYSLGELDAVNLFSGSLQVTVPLGIEYPVSSQLSYRFTLHYNSNFWDINVIDPGSPPQDPPDIQTVLNRRSNAGIGWRLSFGQLLAPPDPQNPSGTFWTFWEGDGTTREMVDVLYQPSQNDAFGDGFFYSDDGSHLRLDVTSAGGCAAPPSPACWRVESPDGTVRSFDSSGRLGLVTDRFGGWMSIEYPTTGEPRWVVRDSHGRQHEVYIGDDPTLCGGQPQCPYQRVNRVELARFGGPSGVRAVYQLHYTTAQVFKLQHTYSCQVSCPTMTVPLLDGITLPDGSSLELPSYNTGSNPTDNGQLEELVLPTLGGYRWAYGGYKVSTDPITNPLSIMPGVTARSIFDRTGAALGSWSYTTFCNRPDGQPLAANETLRCVTDPEGDATVHYFTTGEIGEAAPRGLPYGPVQTDGQGRRLSRQEFEGAANIVNLRRSFWVDYLADVNRSGERISSEKTVFHDDLVQTSPAIPAEVTVDRYDWDGRGHFRTEIYGGNFPDGANQRTVTTRYNPDAGSWECTWDPSQPDPPSCSLVGGEVIPAGNEPWLLETYDFVEIQEAALPVRRREYCFDETTGFLHGIRTLVSGTTRHGHDVIELRSERSGYLGTERYFGGDPLPGETAVTTAATWCSDPVGTLDYQIESFYQHGTRSQRYYAGASFFLEDYDVDQWTGLVKASRDSAGLLTTLTYDALGRITEAKPQADEGAIVQLEYTKATLPSTRASVTTRRRENPPGGSPGALLEASTRSFDDLGRLTLELRQLPTGQEARETLYDVFGRKTSVSEWGAAGKQTRFLEYDRYGRPGRIRPPDSVSGHHDSHPHVSGCAAEHSHGESGDVAAANPVVSAEPVRLHGEPSDYDSTFRPLRSVAAGHRAAISTNGGDLLVRRV